MANDRIRRDFSHGYGGWKRGCRCFVCQRAKADSMARYRARQRGEGSGPVPGTVGVQEALVRAFVAGLGELRLEGESLAYQAILTARGIDHIQVLGKWHLLSSLSRTLLVAMKDLKGVSGLPK